MIKKIISVVLALTIALSCMCVPSFAASGASSDVSSVLGRYYDYLDQYLNGEISYEAFQDKSNAAFHDVESDSDRSALENLLSGLTNAAEGISYASSNVTASFVKIYRDTVKGLDDYFDFWDNVGGTLFDSFEDLWNEYANKNDLTDSAVDMNGYDVALYVYSGSTGKLEDIYYGSVGEFYGFSDDSFKLYIKYDVWVQYLSDGSVVSHLTSSSLTTQYYYSHPQYEFYGSWKNRDGSDVPDDLISPNETTTKDIDDLPDDTDLTDFFNDLLDKLKDLFPDLSTIEGLLRAILAKCTSIDEKINETGEGVKASELQLMLDKAVLALTLQNKENNKELADSNEALLNELIAIRKILQGYDSDEEVDNDTADSILQGLISGLTSGLINLIGFGLGDSEVTELIEICTSAGSIGTKLLSGIVDIICFLGALVPFSIVKTLLETTFNIMFNKNTPADLTFTLEGETYTFLSASFLQIPIVAGVLNIIKGFLTILIAYGWLKWARKFYINLM